MTNPEKVVNEMSNDQKLKLCKKYCDEVIISVAIFSHKLDDLTVDCVRKEQQEIEENAVESF